MRSLMLTTLAFSLAANVAMAGTPAGDAARKDIEKTLGFVPAFIKQVPDSALPGAWEEMKTLQMNPNTALSGKDKELVGLAVASQIPCEYCVFAHTEFAKLNGATEAEIGEAVVMGALARHWSTYFNGLQLDETKFRADLQRALEYAKKGMTPKDIAVVDAKTALADIAQSFGFVPDFLRDFPAEGLAGAWKEMRDVELNPNTAIQPKYKSLIGIGVAAQIPCRYCVVADTMFAKAGGASDREIREAVAMAAIVRHWSTILNGLQADKATFKKDIERLVREAKKKSASTAQR